MSRKRDLQSFLQITVTSSNASQWGWREDLHAPEPGPVIEEGLVASVSALNSSQHDESSSPKTRNQYIYPPGPTAPSCLRDDRSPASGPGPSNRKQNAPALHGASPVDALQDTCFPLCTSKTQRMVHNAHARVRSPPNHQQLLIDSESDLHRQFPRDAPCCLSPFVHRSGRLRLGSPGSKVQAA